ncbi:hypothetical protein [Massilioclostridium coli]|nr:hypothetical protein [Massilioclostridium coli]
MSKEFSKDGIKNIFKSETKEEIKIKFNQKMFDIISHAQKSKKNV